MDEESKSLKINGLLPISVLVGTITYTLSFMVFYAITAIASEGLIYLKSSEFEIAIITLLMMFLGFLGPWIVYVKNIKLNLILRLVIGFCAFLFFFIELPFFSLLIHPLDLLSIRLIPLIFLKEFIPLLTSLAAIPLSFWLGKFLPIKIAKNSKMNSINLRKLTIAALGFWLFCSFVLSIRIPVIGLSLIGYLPLYALLSSLNLELFNYIVLKISNYKKLNQA